MDLLQSQEMSEGSMQADDVTSAISFGRRRQSILCPSVGREEGSVQGYGQGKNRQMQR